VALEYLEKALAIEKQAQNHKNMADIFLNISVVLSNLNKHKDALDAVLNAIFLVQEELLGFTLPQSFQIALHSTLSANSDSDRKENYPVHLKNNQFQQQSSKFADPNDNPPMMAFIDERFDSGEEYGKFLKERVKVLVIAYHNMGAELEHLNLYQDALKIYQKGQKMAEQFLGNQTEVAVELQSILELLKSKMSAKSRPANSKQPLSQTIQRQNFANDRESEMTRTIKSRVRQTEGESSHMRPIDTNASYYEKERKSIIIKPEKGNVHLMSKQRLESNVTPNQSRETLASKSKFQIVNNLRFIFKPQEQSKNNLNHNSIEFAFSTKQIFAESNHYRTEVDIQEAPKQKDSSAIRLISKKSTHSIGNNTSGLKKSNTLPVYVVRRESHEKNKMSDQGHMLTDPAQQISNKSLQQFKMGTVRSDIVQLLKSNPSNERSPLSNNSDQAQKHSTPQSQVSLNMRNLTFSKGHKTELYLNNDQASGKRSKKILPPVIQMIDLKAISEERTFENSHQPIQDQNETANFKVKSQIMNPNKNYTINIKPISEDSESSNLHPENQKNNATSATKVKFRSSLGQKQEIYSVMQETISRQPLQSLLVIQNSPLNSERNSPEKKPQKSNKHPEDGWQSNLSGCENLYNESSEYSY